MPFGIIVESGLPAVTRRKSDDIPIRVRDLNQARESSNRGRGTLAWAEFGGGRTCHFNFDLVLAHDEFVGNVTAVDCCPATLVANFVSVHCGFVGAVHRDKKICMLRSFRQVQCGLKPYRTLRRCGDGILPWCPDPTNS